MNLDLQKAERKSLLRFNKKPPKLKSASGDKKLPNRHSGIVKRIVDFVRKGRSFECRPERLLQQIFALIAVEPSTILGLIPEDNLTVASDGTCVYSASSSRGIKECKCVKNGDYNCKCNRRFSDPQASWGWDSYLEHWFYGHTLYALSCYNKVYKTDLPLYLRFVDAKRHDSVTLIVALAEFKQLSPQLKIKNLVLDSAHGNYPTYELCSEWNMIPFIDLNSKNKGNQKYPSTLTLTDKGVPVCMGGHEMVYNSFCKGRSRHKWRCPLACGKINECSCKEQCSPSNYGRVVYTKPSWDIRLFPPVARGTDQYRTMFKTRTCSERINNRILNDYGLHKMRIRGRMRFSFFTVIASINIQLDARLKKDKLDKNCLQLTFTT